MALTALVLKPKGSLVKGRGYVWLRIWRGGFRERARGAWPVQRWKFLRESDRMNENSLTRGGRWFRTHLALHEPKKPTSSQGSRSQALLCCAVSQGRAQPLKYVLGWVWAVAARG